MSTTTGAEDTSATAVCMTIVSPGDEDVELTSADCADAGVVQPTTVATASS